MTTTTTTTTAHSLQFRHVWSLIKNSTNNCLLLREIACVCWFDFACVCDDQVVGVGVCACKGLRTLLFQLTQGPFLNSRSKPTSPPVFGGRGLGSPSLPTRPARRAHAGWPAGWAGTGVCPPPWTVPARLATALAREATCTKTQFSRIFIHTHVSLFSLSPLLADLSPAPTISVSPLSSLPSSSPRGPNFQLQCREYHKKTPLCFLYINDFRVCTAVPPTESWVSAPLDRATTWRHIMWYQTAAERRRFPPSCRPLIGRELWYQPDIKSNQSPIKCCVSCVG